MSQRKTDPAVNAILEAAIQETKEKLLRDLSSTEISTLTLDQIEEITAKIGAELERTFQRRLLQERTRGLRDNTTHCSCGQLARYRKLASRCLTTRHGEVVLSRPYYYCCACRRGFCPLDSALGLDGGSTTTQVRLWLAQLGARLPFAEGVTLLHLLTAVTVSEATAQRTALTVGCALREAEHARASRHHAGDPPPVERKPKRLYVSMDGIMAPLRNPWKKDGSEGPLLCRYGECKSAVVYEARSTARGDEGVRVRSCVSTLGDVTQFAPLLATEAHRCGHHYARELIFLADGAAYNWTVAAAQFPTAVQIVDLMHAVGHLYAVAGSFFGEGTPEATAWVEARRAELLVDAVPAVIAAIGALPAGSASQHEQQERESGYFRTNAERMRYGTFRKHGYQIASGVMEAGCKQMVHQRLDQVGMHWCETTAEAVLALRGALLSSRPPDLRPYCSAVGSTLPPS